MNRFALVIAALTPLSLATPALAGAAGGFFAGPDSGFQIDLTLRNLSAAGIHITRVELDGDTAAAFPILWDAAGTPGGAAAASLVSITGEDSRHLTLNFGSGWDPGEFFTLTTVDPDGDPGPAGVSVFELIGVRATFTFADASTWVGEFVDDVKPEQGIVLRQVPAPGALTLAAFSTLVATRRRRA